MRLGIKSISILRVPCSGAGKFSHIKTSSVFGVKLGPVKPKMKRLVALKDKILDNLHEALDERRERKEQEEENRALDLHRCVDNRRGRSPVDREHSASTLSAGSTKDGKPRMVKALGYTFIVQKDEKKQGGVRATSSSRRRGRRRQRDASEGQPQFIGRSYTRRSLEEVSSGISRDEKAGEQSSKPLKPRYYVPPLRAADHYIARNSGDSTPHLLQRKQQSQTYQTQDDGEVRYGRPKLDIRPLLERRADTTGTGKARPDMFAQLVAVAEERKHSEDDKGGPSKKKEDGIYWERQGNIKMDNRRRNKRSDKEQRDRVTLKRADTGKKRREDLERAARIQREEDKRARRDREETRKKRDRENAERMQREKEETERSIAEERGKKRHREEAERMQRENEERERRIAAERRRKREREEAERAQREREELERRYAEERRRKRELEKAERAQREKEELERRYAEERRKRRDKEEAERIQREKEELERKDAEEKRRNREREARDAARVILENERREREAENARKDKEDRARKERHESARKEREKLLRLALEQEKSKRDAQERQKKLETGRIERFRVETEERRARFLGIEEKKQRQRPLPLNEENIQARNNAQLEPFIDPYPGAQSVFNRAAGEAIRTYLEGMMPKALLDDIKAKMDPLELVEEQARIKERERNMARNWG